MADSRERLDVSIAQIEATQVPVQLPVQLRITPDRDTVIWLDSFKRWRGAVSFEAHVLQRRLEPALVFDSDVGMKMKEIQVEETGGQALAWIDVVATVDGAESKASRGGVVSGGASGWDGGSWGAFSVPVPDDVSQVLIRLQCAEVPIRRILELDTDLLRTALEDVWDFSAGA